MNIGVPAEPWGAGAITSHQQFKFTTNRWTDKKKRRCEREREGGGGNSEAEKNETKAERKRKCSHLTVKTIAAS